MQIFKQFKNKDMRKLEFNGAICGEVITIERIQKKTAEKLFNSGETIYVQSSNFHPFGAWSQCVEINNKNGDSFESAVNSFEYYNCNNETGYYATFYKRVK